MRQFNGFFIVLFILSSCKSKSYIGVYSNEGEFSENTVILNPDSTFYKWTNGHMTFSYMTGKWHLEGRNLKFTGELPQKIYEWPIYKYKLIEDSSGFIIYGRAGFDTARFNLYYQGEKVALNYRCKILNDKFVVLKDSSESYTIDISFYNRVTIFEPMFRFFNYNDTITECRYYRNSVILSKGQYKERLSKNDSVKFNF